jgi:ParB-like chromosome segregation protein Spo0J
MKDVKIAIDSKDTLATSQLEPLQDDLKSLKDDSYKKLKEEILTDGFSFAVHVYEDHESGKIYIIDGHQRVEALNRMKKEGYNIPQVPVVFIHADDLDHAKRKVLAAASQYGSFNQLGAESFLNTIKGIDLDYLKERIMMPFINFDIMDLEVLNAEKDKILVSSHLREKTDPNKEWESMPEFSQDDKTSFRHIIVHFKTQDDVDKFSLSINQNITDKTKSIWFPAQKNMKTEAKRYTLRKKDNSKK